MFVEAAWLWQSFLLYLALGELHLGKTSKEIAKLLVANKKFEAKQLLTPWLLRETDKLSSLGLAKSCFEMLLLRSIQNLFTIGLMFLIFGPLAALTSRLLIEMHYCWNPKNNSFSPFGNSVAFIVNIIQRLAKTLGIIILLHFGLATVRFHFGKTRKLIIFMIWGFSDVSMTPKTNAFYIWRHQYIPNNSRTIPIILESFCCWQCTVLAKMEKTHAETS